MHSDDKPLKNVKNMVATYHRKKIQIIILLTKRRFDNNTLFIKDETSQPK